MRYEDLTASEKAKYDAYRDVYSFLHYEYKFGKKSKEQIVQDIKNYCLQKGLQIGKDKEK